MKFLSNKKLFNGLAILCLLGFFGLLNVLFFKFLKYQDVMVLGLVVEGALICLILGLYIVQLHKLRTANLEREESLKEKQALEQQFYQAQKMEAIGRLAGGVAHDFNNILAAINGYAEFLAEDIKDKQQKKYAENILQAGGQARDLIDQIMSFSRQRESLKEAVNFTDMISQAVPMLSATLPKTIQLNIDITNEDLAVLANSTQISQTIMNLCVNAADAMDDEHGDLAISVKKINAADVKVNDFITASLPNVEDTAPMRFEEVDHSHARVVLNHLSAQHDYVSLEVKDTGSGMTIELMHKIFEPFFTTKEVGKGTGLGLSSTHGMVLSHQAAMIVDSVLGKGTSFQLFFPLLKETVSAKPDQLVVNDFSGGDGGLILLVEDQEQVRDMMMSLIERLGYEAESCSNGLEALTILNENPDAFDLVISDHNMPVMTGIELAEKSALSEPNLPFIIATGYSPERLKKLGEMNPVIKDILYKPVKHEVLSATIRAALKNKAPQKRAS